MAEIQIPFDPNYTDNMERTKAHGDYPCIVCGRKCNKNTRYHVHVGGGFSTIIDEASVEAEGNGYMGLYPIGPDCLRAHPEIKPYAKDTQPKLDWKALYFDLYRQTCGNEIASDDEVIADARHRAETLSYQQ